jgi:hypothetical protein
MKITPPNPFHHLSFVAFQTWGAALRPCSDSSATTTRSSTTTSSNTSSSSKEPPRVRNPIYVSVGTGLSLGTAVAIVRACCRHRVPEPIRQADIRSRAWIRAGALQNEKKKEGEGAS